MKLKAAIYTPMFCNTGSPRVGRVKQVSKSNCSDHLFCRMAVRCQLEFYTPLPIKIVSAPTTMNCNAAFDSGKCYLKKDNKTEPCTMESLGGNSALTERHRHGTQRERLETQFPERLDTLMYIFLGWNISIICITNGATSDIGQYADR